MLVFMFAFSLLGCSFYKSRDLDSTTDADSDQQLITDTATDWAISGVPIKAEPVATDEVASASSLPTYEDATSEDPTPEAKAADPVFTEAKTDAAVFSEPDIDADEPHDATDEEQEVDAREQPRASVQDAREQPRAADQEPDVEAPDAVPIALLLVLSGPVVLLGGCCHYSSSSLLANYVSVCVLRRVGRQPAIAPRSHGGRAREAPL
jgi:hypothetical protein